MKSKRLISLALLILVLALCMVGCARSMMIDNEEVPLTQSSLDLRHLNMSAEDFDRLQRLAPKCDVVWSIPIDDQRIDSTSASVSLSNFTKDESDLLRYFPALKQVTITSFDAYDTILNAISTYPSCSFVWEASVSGVKISSADTELDLTGCKVDGTELEQALSVLPSLEKLVLFNAELANTTVTAIKEKYPSLTIEDGIQIGKEKFSNSEQKLQFSDAGSIDYATLKNALPLFDNLQEVNLLGATLTDEEKQALLSEFPDCFFLWEVAFPFGLTVQSDITELDLRGYEIDDPNGLIQKVKLLSKLTFLDLSDCGPSNEEMARIRDALQPVKVVWLLHLKYWDLRTDVTAFSMGYRSRKPFPDGKGWYTNVGGKFIYKRLTAKEIEPLQYCTELVALDLGHAPIHDLSAIRNCTKLKYLVIALMDTQDISPIASLTNLEYLEVFYNLLDDDDLDIFLNMKNLKYLNVGGNDIHDIDVLRQLTWLKRLWVNLTPLTEEQSQELIASLPNTEVHAFQMDPGGNGWPNGNPGYQEMRKLFGFSR